MNYNNVISISKMGQGNVANITEAIDGIFLVDSSLEINVSKYINVVILDKTIDGNVKINVGVGSSVKYYVLNSNNTNREFNVSGNVEYFEINTYKNESKTVANLIMENASFDSKCLSICDNCDSKFETLINHKASSTYSNVNNTGVSFGGGKLLFDVTGKVEMGMHKSSCHQLTRGVILDDNSTVSAKPILLIDDYDCNAGHGAAIGNVRDEDLFYLMSRGLNRSEAYSLILKGVVYPFIVAIPFDDYRNELNNRIDELF